VARAGALATCPAACPAYRDAGTAEAIARVAAGIGEIFRSYRAAFSQLRAPCATCAENCCSPPSLDRTPFFQEDALYRVALGAPVPFIPPRPGRCIFFAAGCSLAAHLRPHACVEYRCTQRPSSPRLRRLARRLDRAYIDLIALCTRRVARWWGAYSEEGAETDADVVWDRFGRRYDRRRPFAAMGRRYPRRGDG
jgi:hypothetical protein